jgi:class 3 adenylate cyclase
VVTLNDRLDYFGQTVNIAARVQGLADVGEVYISEQVYTRLQETDVLAGCVVSPEQVSLQGIGEKARVRKITIP